MRRLFVHLPHDPRCRVCGAPFAGIGSIFTRVLGKQPASRSPSLCRSCFEFLESHQGGAEIECSMLFADIRGSTSLAERLPRAEFRAIVQRFFAVGEKAVFAHEGAIDKFVGDEIVAFFYPLLAGDRHAASAIAAARHMLRDTGHADPDGPWVPVGVGVHTGRAWVGAVGEGSYVELTAIGDAVNVAARLGAAAEAGEILASLDAARSAGLDPGADHTTMTLKGKEAPTEVVRLRI
jgi:adenylate cyclase